LIFVIGIPKVVSGTVCAFRERDMQTLKLRSTRRLRNVKQIKNEAIKAKGTSTVQLDDIIITDELLARKSRPVDVFAERRALNTIARRMSYGRGAVFDTLCDMALTLCRACSAGISILDHTDGAKGFTWEAVAGKLEDHVGGKAPRHHSPCGVTLERRAAQLFSHPERCFEWMRQAAVPIVEGLVIPLYKNRIEAYGTNRKEAYGTIWIMLHEEGRFFDKEDARIMTALGEHASAALQMLSRTGN
jgi:hypothetical protein